MTTQRLLTSTILALPLLLLAQPDPTLLKAGDPIPDVSVRTTAGDAVSLAKLVSGKPTVLIFYRGGWCPYCTRHLQALAGIEKDLLAAGYQILAISPDQPSKIVEMPEREKLGYTLLSDSSLETANAFGLTFQVSAELVAKYKNEYKIDLEAASGQTHHRLPHPAVFLVDGKGVIRFASVNEDYKVRLEPEKILEAARGVR